MSALPASTELLTPAGFRQLDHNVCRAYAKYMRAYGSWLQQPVRGGERLALLLAKLRVEIEYYVALYQAAVDADQATEDCPEPPPRSTWQNNELAAIDAHLAALRSAPIESVRAVSLIARLLLIRDEVMATALVPDLPASCPGNNLYYLLKLLRDGGRRPTKESYLKKKIAALLNLADTADEESCDT